MRPILLFLLFFMACQDYNSNSGDRGRYGPVELDESDPNFRRAYTIIQNRCVSCHDHRHDNWAEYKSNADWESSGLITPHDPDGSELIQRIVNSARVESNMPPGGSPLPNDEYNHLRKWVTEFQ